MPAASARLQVPGRPSNPRRASPQSSVSLRHAAASARANKGSPSSNSSSVNAEQPSSSGNGSPSSLQPHMGRGSSGESSSNAENWFQKSNNAIREGGGAFGDGEPPFFLRNPSSEETPPDVRHQSSKVGHASDSLPLRTELLQLGTASGSDDFRGVIDDLTIQNKKLKRRLRKYEKLHDAHLKDDKLFEVRVHGLPPEKKRELEDMLRKFASGLGTTGDNAFPSDGYNSLLPMLNKESSNATAHQTDSAYASMSLSGPGSSAQSGSDKRPKRTPRDYLSARQKNIHSYLHDIPVGLLPQQAYANMTERAKKKLLVRKVEQLFVGKGAVGGHQQPLQQQEVSQSAAHADRSARAEAGQTARLYGAREANMLVRKRSDNDKDTSSDDGPAQRQENASSGRVEKADSDNVEQRPTQPIDLDPDRAQIPQDNIRYMRAMGFSPPHPDFAPEDGHGWIYINFLFNMAQLHTLNVTTDFARDAIAEISKKLEVSQDGRKVRWRGGRSATRTSSAGDDTPETGSSSERHDGQSPRKRLKTAHNGGNIRSSAQARGGASSLTHEGNRHVYTPMFHHKSSEDDTDDSSSEGEDLDGANESSEQRWDAVGGSSGVTSSGVHTTPFRVAGQKRKKVRGDDGPIIFYNNARFCTDLSGERRPMANSNVPMYTTIAAHPIGDRCDPNSDIEGRGPLAEAVSLPEAMDLDDNPTDSSQELDFPPSSPPKTMSGDSEVDPIDLEVTGIGGVWPDDNFMLSVETRHAQMSASQEADRTAIASKTRPTRLSKLFSSSTRNPPGAQVGHEVTDVEVTKLQPSELPPALAFMDYDDDESFDSDSDASDASPPDPHAPKDDLPPEVVPQPLAFGYRYASSDNASDADDDEDDDSEGEDSDDGEVDLLAGIREARPEFVRAQEREYDANVAERLAEEIPAGSSAATAGGWSGFNSPASEVRREDVRQARDAMGVRAPPGMGKSGTGDSMAVLGMEGSGVDDADDDDDDDGMSDVRS